MNTQDVEINAKIFQAGILAILNDYSYTTTNVGRSVLTDSGKRAVINFVEQMGPMLMQANRDSMVEYAQKFLITTLKETT